MKNVIQGTTLSGTGAVSIAPGAEITIRNPAGQLVPLWADRAGTQPHDNPFLTDNEGQFRVYADSGWVHVRAQKDGSVREWRYVPIGSAAAMDIGEVYAALGSEIYSSVSEGLSNSAEGDFFLVESSGSLDLYRVVNGVAEQREQGIEADAILATRAYADGVAAEAESNATNAAVAAASAAYQQATEYSDSELQTHRESGDHDGRYYTKTEVDQSLSTKVDDDDPRLSDPREWTAEVVSQPEAEAGTSSVPRKWTAERVRQAVEAALAGGAAGIYTSVAEGLAATAEGNFFWVADQASEDVLTLYRVVESDAELWASVPSSDAVHELTDRAEAAAESAEQAAQRAEDAAADTGLPSPIVPNTGLWAAPDGSGYIPVTQSQLMDLAGIPIGGYVYGSDDPDDPPPPSSHFIRCAAGLTGPGQYNAGKLTSETVTGSAPLITATAVVDDPESPLYGRTVHLIETERRFLRAGSPGTVQDDALQNITGEVALSISSAHVAGAFTNPTSDEKSGRITGDGNVASGRLSFSAANSPGARTDVETRPRNIGVAVYRRIK